jgi:hypothetical protein
VYGKQMEEAANRWEARAWGLGIQAMRSVTRIKRCIKINHFEPQNPYDKDMELNFL